MNEDDAPHYPPETHKVLSWGALRFIHSPTPRLLQIAVAFICGSFCLAVLLTFFVELDVSVEAMGEIDTETGVRETAAEIDGFINEVFYKTGDTVHEGDTLASMRMDAATESELSIAIKAMQSHLEQLVSKPIEQIPRFDASTLPIKKVFDTSVLNALSGVEQSADRLAEQRSRIQGEFRKQIAPHLAKIKSLQTKLQQLQKSKQRRNLKAFIESITDEIGKLEAETTALRAQEAEKLTLAQSDLTRALRLAVGELELFLRKHRIVAPITGTLAKIHYGPNAHINQGKTFAVIIPRDAQFVGSLKVASKDVGKVRTGQVVYYRVEAYPYQDYGLFEGQVLEFDRIRDLSSANIRDDFTVRATLLPPPTLNPEISSKLRLVVGMRFSASVVIERKSIFRIIRERLFARK